MPEQSPQPDQPEAPEEPEQPKQRRFPTAFTVLAIVLLVVWVLSFIIPSGTYELDPKTGGPVPGTYEELPSCDDVEKGTRCIDKSLEEQLSGALDFGAQRPLRDRERPRRRRPVQLGVPLRLGDDLPLRPRGRRLRQRDDEDRGDPNRHRPTRAALQAHRVAAGDRADEHLRPRRNHVRHVGGDAWLLRPVGAVGTGAQLRPDGGGVDHLPRRRHRRARPRP